MTPTLAALPQQSGTASVLFIQMDIFEEAYPLVAGYLTAYALRDPALRDAYSFHSLSYSVSVPFETFRSDIRASPHDVYALSCYVWNMGAMRAAIAEIRSHSPDALIILGGPQVINAAEDVVPPEDANIIVCNGEGELVFSRILTAHLEQTGLANIPGTAIRQNGQIVTAPADGRMRTLDDIPSPYLEGLFQGDHKMAILETNRGCPFHCSFCFWGAATNDKVNKFDETRVRDEITLIAERRIARLYIADANWGMLKRDVDLTEHIVACNKQYSAPLMVFFSSSKNSQSRVEEITQMLADNGLINTHAVSLQTMNEQTLEVIQRQNIRKEDYLALQTGLTEKKIGSYVELIWPLPGETLRSYQAGVGELIRAGGRNLVTYPNLLLKNTPMFASQEALGVKTKRIEDPYSEEEFIIQTADAGPEDVIEGQKFITGTQALFNAKTAVTLMTHLDRTGQMPFQDFIAKFVQFLYEHRGSDIAAFHQKSVDTLELGVFGNVAEFYLLLLHRKRQDWTALIREFSEQHLWWDDPVARLAFELDVFLRPYVFSNTLPEYFAHRFEFVKLGITDPKMREFSLTIEDSVAGAVGRLLPGMMGHNAGASELLVQHPVQRSAYSDDWEREDFYQYINGVQTNIDRYLPSVQMCEPVAVKA